MSGKTHNIHTQLIYRLGYYNQYDNDLIKWKEKCQNGPAERVTYRSQICKIVYMHFKKTRKKYVNINAYFCNDL